MVAGNCVSISSKMDTGGEFVLRGWHAFAGAFVLSALHMAFNANPMWTAKSLGEFEAARKKSKGA